MNRKHLTHLEVDKLLHATKGQRHEERDRALILIMYRHGLRVSEACGMKLEQVDLDSEQLHVRRLKNGINTSHPLRRVEIQALKRWLAKRPASGDSHLFLSNRKKAMSRRTVGHLIREYGRRAKLSVEVHPHMLRHACGFALADQGADAFLIRDYMGHRNIQNTTIYTASNPVRFERLWR